MKIDNLEELFKVQLQTLYDIEVQLINALPLLIDSAKSDGLKNALNQHLEVTKKQRQRLEEIGRDRDMDLEGKSDQGMMHILLEGQRLVNQIEDPEIRDSAIMGGTEKVEHYEMAAYQSAKTTAHKLDDKEVADKLDETLKEEKQAADSISLMAQGGLMGKINQALS